MNYKKDTLVGYDFQGWPICQMNLKEILIGLGAREENNQLVFDLDDPTLEAYPRLFEDDGMGYGIDEQCIVEAETFKSNEEGKDIIYVNIFRADIPTLEEKSELIKRWEEDEEAVLKNSKNFSQTYNK